MRRLLPSRISVPPLSPQAPSGRGLLRSRWGRMRLYTQIKPRAFMRRLLPSRIRVPPPSRREAYLIHPLILADEGEHLAA